MVERKQTEPGNKNHSLIYLDNNFLDDEGYSFSDSEFS
jgi:hypothetical protein